MVRKVKQSNACIYKMETHPTSACYYSDNYRFSIRKYSPMNTFGWGFTFGLISMAIL